ncbi:hypothetical protein Tco_0806868, partial [Tanacetum coccineum]
DRRSFLGVFLVFLCERLQNLIIALHFSLAPSLSILTLALLVFYLCPIRKHGIAKGIGKTMGYQKQDSHDSYSHQSHHDPNDFEKSLTELNNDVKNDLEDFKSCIRSMGTVHDKLFDRDDQSKTDLEKLITKFLDGQRVLNMFVKNNVNDIILKMKQNEKNCQTIFKNMERKTDEWSKPQNVSSEQTDRTDPPPPQAHTKHMNVVFIGSVKSDDSSKIQKDPPPPIIVNNKVVKDKHIKTSKRGYYVVETKEYTFREYIPKIPYPIALKVNHSHLNRIVKES